MEHVNLVMKLLAHNPLALLHINGSRMKQTSDVEEGRVQKQQTGGKAFLPFPIGIGPLKALANLSKQREQLLGICKWPQVQTIETFKIRLFNFQTSFIFLLTSIKLKKK
jgi:hypothetical protein